MSSLVFGGGKREGTAAVVVGAGLVVDTRALLSVVVVGGAFEDSYCWLAASMSRSSSFSESRQDSMSSLNSSPGVAIFALVSMDLNRLDASPR